MGLLWNQRTFLIREMVSEQSPDFTLVSSCLRTRKGEGSAVLHRVLSAACGEQIWQTREEGKEREKEEETEVETEGNVKKEIEREGEER
jgi:hypothetical protein